MAEKVHPAYKNWRVDICPLCKLKAVMVLRSDGRVRQCSKAHKWVRNTDGAYKLLKDRW